MKHYVILLVNFETAYERMVRRLVTGHVLHRLRLTTKAEINLPSIKHIQQPKMIITKGLSLYK